MDTDEQLFKCGFSVERGMIQAPPDFRKIELKPDWDWHRLLEGVKASERHGSRIEAPGVPGGIS